MPDTNQQQADKIKDLISEGDTKRAIALLYAYCEAIPSLFDSALMLKNSLKNLEDDVMNGIISRENELIEERKLVRNAITLANQLGSGGPAPVKHERLLNAQTDEPRSNKGSLSRKTWMVIASMAFVGVVLTGVLMQKTKDGISYDVDAPFKLTIAISTPAALHSSLQPKGRISASIAGEQLGTREINGPCTITYDSVPGRLGNGTAELTLLEMNHAYTIRPKTDVVGLASRGHYDYVVEPVMQRYDGRLLDQHGKAIIGATLNFNEGMASATTSQNGQYAVELPKPMGNQDKVKIKISLGVRVLQEETYLQAQQVLEELKVMQ